MASDLQKKLDYILDEKANKIIPYNIRKGVEIFGVSGECVGVDSTDATATPADIREGKTAYVNDQKITGTYKGVETTDATAKAGDILIGRTAYTAEGKTTGQMSNNGILQYTPKAENQEIPAGYTSGGTVKGDANLVAENIKKGTTIFGIEGLAEDEFTDHDEYDACLELANEIHGEGLDLPIDVNSTVIINSSDITISDTEPKDNETKIWISKRTDEGNLFEEITWTDGYISSTGTIEAQTNASKYSSAITVEPNTSYIVEILETTDTYTPWFAVSEYNSAGSFITRQANTTVKNTYIFITGATTSSVKISARNMVGATKIRMKKYVQEGMYIYNENTQKYEMVEPHYEITPTWSSVGNAGIVVQYSAAEHFVEVQVGGWLGSYIVYSGSEERGLNKVIGQIPAQYAPSLPVVQVPFARAQNGSSNEYPTCFSIEINEYGYVILHNYSSTQYNLQGIYANLSYLI